MSRDAQKLAVAAGFVFWKYGKGPHQLWRHPQTGQIITMAKNLSAKNLRNFEAELRRKAR